LRGAAAAGLLATVPWSTGRVRALTAETPEALKQHKWEDELPRPTVATPVSRRGGVDRYVITERPDSQAVLPTATGLTTPIWGYEGSYPGPTIEARPGRSVEVEWRNQLPSSHVLTNSVDPRVHGAGGDAPEVRTVVHLHGGVVAPEDDGYPEA